MLMYQTIEKTHMPMRKIICIFTLLLFFQLSLCAQPGRHFDPERFQAALEQHITSSAGITQHEAARFLPEYRTMRKRVIELMEQKRLLNRTNDPATIIRKRDQIDLKIKKLQVQYHDRFLKILPAEKVLKVIQAEDQFHRQAFKRMKR